VLQKLRDNQL
jgi:hypothetical protein